MKRAETVQCQGSGTRPRDAAACYRWFVVTALLAAAPADAQRYAEVYGQQVGLQTSLRNWLQESLSRVAHPYDTMVTVQLDMRGQVQQQVNKQGNPGMETKFGGKKALKLPGLPRTTVPSEANSGPEFSSKMPSQEKVEVEP